MTTLQNFLDAERDEYGRTPPAEWHICDSCRGNGTSSAYLGDVTEWLTEDPDAAKDYMGGAYDRHCAECGGTGKVQHPTGAAAERWAAWLQGDADDAYTMRMESGGY